LAPRSFGRHAAKRIENKQMSPEFETALMRALEADAIHGRHEDSVGDGVRALNRAPGVELCRAEFLLFGRMPSDRRGIKKNVRAAEARKACALSSQLLPPHHH